MTRVPDLGPRGEGWVALQTVALGAALVAGLLGPGWPGPAATLRSVSGLALAGAGGALALAGIRRLGAALSPFPRPVEGSALREDGVYRRVRHPIYGGLLLIALGWSLLGSPAALVPTAVLAVVLEGKRRREEAWLAAHDPAYPGYRKRAPRRFVPYVW